MVESMYLPTYGRGTDGALERRYLLRNQYRKLKNGGKRDSRFAKGFDHPYHREPLTAATLSVHPPSNGRSCQP